MILLESDKFMYLFSWYIHGTELQDFYALLSFQNPDIVKNISIYIYQL
jgi:hypothetical protein